MVRFDERQRIVAVGDRGPLVQHGRQLLAWRAGRSSLLRAPRPWTTPIRPATTPRARLAHMDAQGIYAQVLYPNVIAFEGHAFMAMARRAS